MLNNDTVLINTGSIESCWETADACFVKMSSGKLWVLERQFIVSSDTPTINTMEYIEVCSKENRIVKLPIKSKKEV